MKFLKEIRNSGPARFTKALALKKFPGYRHRDLTESEIVSLERDSNFSENWSLVKVAQDFQVGRIRNCIFSGSLYLPNFFGNVLGPDGVHIPTGLYHSHLHNAFVENCHVSYVSLVSNQVLSQGVMLRHVGSISHVGVSRFGIGTRIQLGSETGARKIPLFPGMDLSHAHEMLERMGDAAEWNELNEKFERICLEFDSPLGHVGKDAIITNTQTVRNSWIGASSQIDGVVKIYHSCLISAMEQPISIKDGAIVEHSILHWGVRIRSHAQVTRCLMMESSGASRGARVLQSVIGPNSLLEQGEVSHSLLGPFVGFHHQSLLISTLWPEGLGNVAHGACVGSNHTGKKPNQELIPGRGMFFGLACQVSFPGNYEGSPWSLVASGTRLPAQRVSMPFALFAEGREGLKILPGWVIGYNAYALSRNPHKYQRRNQCRRQPLDFDVFTDKVLVQVIQAYHHLDGLKLKPRYDKSDLPALGECSLEESDRQKALIFYKQFLERGFYLKMVEQAEKSLDRLKAETSVRKLLATDLLKDLAKVVNPPQHLYLAIKRHRGIEKAWFEMAMEGLKRERVRGREIIDDYDVANPIEDPQSEEIFQDLDKANQRVRAILAALK